MSVKGQEFPAYDPRGIQGWADICDFKPWCHLVSHWIASETLGIPIETDPLETEGKLGIVMAFQMAWPDASGLAPQASHGSR